MRWFIFYQSWAVDSHRTRSTGPGPSLESDALNATHRYRHTQNINVQQSHSHAVLQHKMCGSLAKTKEPHDDVWPPSALVWWGLLPGVRPVTGSRPSDPSTLGNPEPIAVSAGYHRHHLTIMPTHDKKQSEIILICFSPTMCVLIIPFWKM